MAAQHIATLRREPLAVRQKQAATTIASLAVCDAAGVPPKREDRAACGMVTRNPMPNQRCQSGDVVPYDMLATPKMRRPKPSSVPIH